MSLLERIHSPADLRSLDKADIAKLAAEMRHEIIQTVARNAGHLAPNLGVVELTLALHRVFDSPRDKIIWDVGHQSYPHKLLTGRYERFHTLRQLGGIAGYPRRVESPHDPFGTSHGSTSISAALGFATARDLKGEQHHVVAVIGDGGGVGARHAARLDEATHVPSPGQEERGEPLVALHDETNREGDPERFRGVLLETAGQASMRAPGAVGGGWWRARREVSRRCAGHSWRVRPDTLLGSFAPTAPASPAPPPAPAATPAWRIDARARCARSGAATRRRGGRGIRPQRPGTSPFRARRRCRGASRAS